ncbi:unnamed protein product [Pseudo-nitzschia multistriata]|uniref:HSF-type DNA-binding domain-containing protein n=1 Tax=Pseudo-nitzschia multistriata TaxID=183589 RepID=A0A448ZSV6_9STRA|nr:unnamed protein product [Pseudo-nitzschia multistriata]
MQSTHGQRVTVPIKKRTPLFPQRLYSMLENSERCGYNHVISWMPDGTSFKIHADSSAVGCSFFGRTTADADADTNDDRHERLLVGREHRAILEVLQRNGFNQKRYKSFLRQLQLYGFQRTFTGPGRGECRHPFLVKGRPELLEGKTVKDFQHKSDNDGICVFADELIRRKTTMDADTDPGNPGHRGFGTTPAPEEPMQLFLTKDDYNYWMPSSPFLEFV